MATGDKLYIIKLNQLNTIFHLFVILSFRAMFLIDPKGVVVAREVSFFQDKPARDVTIMIFV